MFPTMLKLFVLSSYSKYEQMFKKLNSHGPELSLSSNSLPLGKTRFLQSQKNLKAKVNLRSDIVKDPFIPVRDMAFPVKTVSVYSLYTFLLLDSLSFKLTFIKYDPLLWPPNFTFYSLFQFKVQEN